MTSRLGDGAQLQRRATGAPNGTAPKLLRVRAPSIRITVLPAGFGTGFGVVVATTLVGAV
jgi:hypothetical protein